MQYIPEDIENASPYFSNFSQTVNAIEKLLAPFDVQLTIGTNPSLNILSRDWKRLQNLR